jgi:hypothetical protein
MWLRRALDWLNYNPIETVVTELRRDMKQLREDLVHEIAPLKQGNPAGLPQVTLWEAGAVGGLKGLQVVRTQEGTVIEPTIDDPLQQWLWKRAWNGCAQTGQWDLLNAVAGIAQAIREDGIPLSAGLKATALPYRGGKE